MATNRTSFSNAKITKITKITKIIPKRRNVGKSTFLDVNISDWKDDLNLNLKLFNLYVTEENFLRNFVCNIYYRNELVRF